MVDVAPGKNIDGFEVGECLHTSAMGTLYAVTRTGSEFPLLMKVPRLGEPSESAELILAFETEAMILPRLRGPHVPRFVAAGDVTTVPYLVTERVPGMSLDRRPAPAMPAADAARIGAAIADALHSVHAQGAIHLDLKPDNVMIRPDGLAVLIDFALAHHQELPDLLAEERRFVAGSAPYISPEQVRGARSDPRSDLFSLGVVLYEIATGRLPFGTPLTLAGLRDRLWLDPRPPSTRGGEMPPWLQEVILRCLEPEADRRYQSAAHVAFDLRLPEQVILTERSRKSDRPGFLAQAARWWRARDIGALQHASRWEADAAPVVMVAVDTTHPDDPRQPEIQAATRRILLNRREFRLICVSVIPAPFGGEEGSSADAQIEHRIRLRHWTRPLGIEAGRMSFHVLENSDPAESLVEFAQRNNVDLIVLGAPAPDERALAWWRSVASSVTARASCSVHVIRCSGEAPAPPVDADQSVRGRID
jgi:serine/threonine protein kinase